MPDALISYPFTDEGLRDALEALGTTPDAVRRNLIGMGITGVPESACNCPVAKYLRRSIDGATGIAVDHCGVLVYSPGASIQADLTHPVKLFIEWFDLGDKRLDGLVSDASS